MTVVMIIGLLSAIAVGVLGISRANSRDAKRVSDVQVIRAALEHYWLRNARFPSESDAVSLGTGSYAVLSSNGFEEAPGTGNVFLTLPTGPRANEFYQYESTVFNGYALEFTMERVSDVGPAGTYYAHADGTLDTDPTSK